MIIRPELVFACLLSAAILLPLQALAQTQAPMLPPPFSAATANNTRAHFGFGGSTTYNVNVVCASGALAHKSETVPSGQAAATINVNCGSTATGTGAPTPGPPGPPGPKGDKGDAGAPATICVVTPDNSCVSTSINATTTATTTTAPK